jgi:hypothetical protein
MSASGKLLRDEENMSPLFLLMTQGAVEKLRENHGLSYSPATLRKLRCLGGGPAYRIFNGRPFYTEADLAAWVEQGLSEPRRSSSEAP